MNIICRFIWKPAQTSGSASVKLCGLKNAWRTWCSACIALGYFRTGTFEKSRLNHFFWSFPTVPFGVSVFDRAVETSGVSFEPFCEHRAVLLVRDDLAARPAP